MSRTSKGLTLIEGVISLSILGIIAAVGILLLAGTERENALDVQAERVVASLREAQSRSIAGEETSTWGVHIDETTHFFSIFHGTSYAGATETNDIHLPSDIRFSNLDLVGAGDDIKFDRLTGRTSQPGNGPSNRAVCLTTAGATSLCKRAIRVSPVGQIEWVLGPDA